MASLPLTACLSAERASEWHSLTQIRTRRSNHEAGGDYSAISRRRSGRDAGDAHAVCVERAEVYQRAASLTQPKTLRCTAVALDWMGASVSSHRHVSGPLGISSGE